MTPSRGDARAMVLWRVAACLLVLSIVPLAPLAFASPIDPSFPGGWYDGGDFDDVIDVITSSVGAVDLVPPLGVRPLPVVAGAVVDTALAAPPSAFRPSSSGRAPPLS